MRFVITITKEEQKIIDNWLGTGNFQAWLQHAVDNKLRQRIDATILAKTNINPKKLTTAQKLAELKKIDLLTEPE